MPLVIRSETPADVVAIRAVHEAAFAGPLEARLVDALRDGSRLVVSLVAELDDAVVGHIAFSPVTAAESERGVGLAPLAVHSARQRQGIGGRLVQAGLQICRERNVPFVVVLGDPAYYRRFGFVPASSRGLHDEYGGGAAFQVIELEPDGLPSGAGSVRYAPEFSIFSPPNGDD